MTTKERTAVDVACQGNFEAALTVFDSALRLGADREMMSDILQRRRRRGIAVARRALPLASGLSASVGESWSRAQMILAHLPPPILQQKFLIDGRTFFTDFLLPDNTIGEFDGIKKYTKLVREDQESSDVIVEEKIREDLLRSRGFDVVRWIWRDLERGYVVPRLRQSLARQ
ncbi:hypothetical protein GOEFS_046_00930 [Gordonia effusa NBRC 100432]|uniref:DUF559 domain-containing protein n=2 Tax=Gordonia effusa TaxID=263908 RepID=H0QZ86_9ACTN|nr:hypothetical protein GOEFS_046_00930 [Gordonia effusa NBRC 100432]